jgi:hypothetical protein
MKITVNSIKKHIMNMDGLHLLTLFIAGYVLIYVLISMVNRYGGIVEGMTQCSFQAVNKCGNDVYREKLGKALSDNDDEGALGIVQAESKRLYNADYSRINGLNDKTWDPNQTTEWMKHVRGVTRDNADTEDYNNACAILQTECKVAETDVPV